MIEPEVSNHPDNILGEGRDYRDYILSSRELFLGWGAGFFSGVFVGIAFQMNFVVVLIIAALGSKFGVKVYRDHLIEKNRKILLLQFVSLLDGLKNSLLTGCNSFEAFEIAFEDMVAQFGEHSLIVSEVERILVGFENNISLELLLEDFSARSDLEDIKNFVSAFSICNRYGGDLAKVINDVDEIIKSKVATDMEIGTTITEKKTELNVMIIMPLIVVFALRSTGNFQEFSIANAMIKAVSIGLFVAAYLLGKKIIDIKV